MKTPIKFLGIISLVTLFLFASCSKEDEDDTPPAKTTTELLTAGFWKTTAMTIDPGVNINGTIITDFYAQLFDCTKDDLKRFDSDGKITDDEGATKCDPNDPQTTNDGTWVLSADKKSISIKYPGEDAFSFEISTLDENTLSGVFTIVEDFGSGPLNYAITQTMKLQ